MWLQSGLEIEMSREKITLRVEAKFPFIRLTFLEISHLMRVEEIEFCIRSIRVIFGS